jgi:hypothetical protein
MIACGKDFFNLVPSGTKIYGDHNSKTEIIDGIVYNHHNGSFEDLFYHSGTEICIATKTPGYRINLKTRVEANYNLIAMFIRLTELRFA